MIQEIESFVDPRPRRGSNSILHLACRDTLRCLSSPASLDLFLPFSPVILPPPFFFFARVLSLLLAHWLTYPMETKGATSASRKRAREKERGAARAGAKGWKERREKERKKERKEPSPDLCVSVLLPAAARGGIVRLRCARGGDEDAEQPVDSGIEGGTEKERTRGEGEGKRSATKVAVTRCKASKPNGRPWRKRIEGAILPSWRRRTKRKRRRRRRRSRRRSRRRRRRRRRRRDRLNERGDLRDVRWKLSCLSGESWLIVSIRNRSNLSLYHRMI